MTGTLLLSVDFEDWHQLMHRRVGVADWREAGPALARQTEATLALFDELGVRATFFVLGMAARAHPALVTAIAERGHEIASHGDAHLPVGSQTPAQLAADLHTSSELIRSLTGVEPRGYRAPAFSITSWAYEVIADAGFAYDSSQHDSPGIRDRARPQRQAPHPIELPDGRRLWEFPLALRPGRVRVPVGGGTYWGVLPLRLVLGGLAGAGPDAALYLHPHELDPERLRALLPRSATAPQRLRAAARVVQRELPRRRAARVLRAVAERFELITYGDCHARLSAELDGRAGAGAAPLHGGGAGVRRPL